MSVIVLVIGVLQCGRSGGDSDIARMIRDGTRDAGGGIVVVLRRFMMRIAVRDCHSWHGQGGDEQQQAG